MKTLKFTTENILKILNGTKTATTRKYKVNSGCYKLDEKHFIEIVVYYYSSANLIKNKDQYAKAEGFLSWHDMYNNCIFKHTRDFMDGKIPMYVYKIISVNKVL